MIHVRRGQLKCDGTRTETRFLLSAKRMSSFNSLNAELNPICHLLALLGGATIVVVSRLRVLSAGASVQSTTGSRGVRISGSNAGYTMFRGSVKGTGYALHSPVSPSLPLPCVTVCHHISAGLYHIVMSGRKVAQLQKCITERVTTFFCHVDCVPI